MWLNALSTTKNTHVNSIRICDFQLHPINIWCKRIHTRTNRKPSLAFHVSFCDFIQRCNRNRRYITTSVKRTITFPRHATQCSVLLLSNKMNKNTLRASSDTSCHILSIPHVSPNKLRWSWRSGAARRCSICYTVHQYYYLLDTPVHQWSSDPE